MKKGTQYTGTVERIDFPGKGIVNIEGEKVVIKDTITGQKVSFAISKARKGKKEGRLLEVVEKSPLETVEAKCRHFGPCGGCNYQTIPYETQLNIKEDQVKRLLGAVTEELPFQGIKGSPKQWEYRNKMEFSFGDEVKDGPLSLGLHKKGSFHDIITTSGCCIVHSDYNKILTCVLECSRELGLPFYRKMSHIGYLRHLLVRRAEKTGEILINLITSSQWELCTSANEETDGQIPDTKKKDTLSEAGMLEELKTRLLSLPIDGKIVGFLHTVNDSQADIVKSDRTDIIYGQDYFYEELLGLTFKISTFSFFQTNSLGAEVLYDTAREFVGETKDKLIFDLYSGTGTIAQLLAPVAKKVIGVEIVEEAVIAAKENAALNNLDNCEFIAGDVLKVIDTIEERPDLIVLDPPRDGVNPKALEKIIQYGVERIVYISCKPTSLARDLVVLQEKGYRVEKVCCVDMFPNTGHVETVVLMSRKDK
ncbi:23S rRNA (uracil(1939)-C(5))-methyltransferase RlmD [Anaerocolumna xylanovorans]|uniref:23S rRNA (Uracil-5-)-methyltransferase RumA n=1 Tax=Anaerocolumna xylanovorans DSM 12503 TaxID=1121345 RepID=A0A1M7XX59_9FIRM|nr:23S rRNA (uracil(1939)-C(5))-methyltransferase RlmD [Anaerocolumna xylanovorans]SHO43461.1 23S rRNA (uracil-5-)-methyltransferase RumA [Anaerocolumna xylanovorans DSM 12503]